jgi:hypothetical protein
MFAGLPGPSGQEEFDVTDFAVVLSMLMSIWGTYIGWEPDSKTAISGPTRNAAGDDAAFQLNIRGGIQL